MSGCEYCDNLIYREDPEYRAQVRIVDGGGWLYINVKGEATAMRICNCPWCGRAIDKGKERTWATT